MWRKAIYEVFLEPEFKAWGDLSPASDLVDSHFGTNSLCQFSRSMPALPH